MYSSDFKAQIDRDASTSKPPEELPSMYHSKFSAQLLASRTGKPVVVPLWPYGDLQMNGDQAPEIPMYDEPIASPQQTESEKFVTKFFFVWFILVGAFAAMIFGNVMPPGINPLIYLTGASALALSLCRNSRGISFIAVREYDICFLWFVAGKLEKKEKLDYYSLRKIELVEPDRFGKPKIRFSAGIRGTSKTIPLESFPSRERWRYFLDACRKCNSNLQVDPAIEEKLMPDPKDAGYTELWL